MAELDPIALQVATGALRAACEEMGAVLVRSAHSANIKERRDCSTALFDARGEMVMQAEHIPVHLGAMPAAVRAVLDEEHTDGAPWILNDPYRGGTHLPDITVITPAFGDGVRHRAEVDRDVLGLHDELAGGVEERRRTVAALLDVRRVRGANERGAHLLAGSAQRARHDL